MAQFFLILLFLYTVFSDFIPGIAFTLGGSAVWTGDVLVFIVFLIVLFKYSHKLRDVFNKKYKLRKYIVYIFFLLLLPILTGIINGHNIFSVFRDGRSLFLCIIPFIILLELNTYEKWFKYVKIISVTLFIALLIFIISFVFNLHFQYLGSGQRYVTEYGTIPQFGLDGAYGYYPLIIFFLLTSLIKNIKTSFSKSQMLSFILFAFSFLAVYLSGSRGYFISVMVGLFVNLVLLKAYLSKKILFSSLLGLILIILFSSSINQYLGKSPVMQRYLTVLEGSEQHNIYLRASAFDQAKQLMNSKVVGSGYGGEQQSGDAMGFSVYNLTHLLALNSYAWGLYRLGFLGLILFCLFYLLFILRIRKTLIVNNNLLYTIVTSIIVYLFITIPWAAGANVFFRGSGSTITLGIIIGLVISLENILEKGKVYKQKNIQKISSSIK